MNPVHIGAGIAALLVIILGGLLKSSYARNGELEASLQTQADQTIECADANSTMKASIIAMQLTIDNMVAKRKADAEERERVLDEREQELAQARARADRLEREREDEQSANPDCADLTSLSLDFFCPATAQQLRQRSIGEGGNGD
jgi:hypothetical protein